MVIVSFTTQNPDRQRELHEGVAQLMGSRPFTLLFPTDEIAAESALANAEVFYTWRFSEAMFRAAPRLRWVHVSGAGVDRLLFPEFRASPITLTNSRGMHGPYMAEWTLAALLHIAHRFSEIEQWRRDRLWKEHKDPIHRHRFLLEGKRALVVGFGAIGEAIAKKLAAVGLICEGVGTHARSAAFPVHASDQLPAIIGGFDIVVSILPNVPSTRRLFDRNLFSRMKRDSIFVNLGRGSTMEEAALIDALKHGPLAHAALDVFDQEPLPEDSPLHELPNLFMSPHISGNFPDYTKVAINIFLDNLKRYLNHEPLANVVNKERGY